MGIRARARARACITHDHTTPHVVDIRSSVERRMIELYLNHRDRLINILDMIDGKERSVCAHLSKIGHRNVSPITRKCARARARESVQKKKREPLTPGRESGEVSRRDEKKKKSPWTFPVDGIFFAHPRAPRNYLWPSNRRFATNNFRISSNFCWRCDIFFFFFFFFPSLSLFFSTTRLAHANGRQFYYFE